MRNLARSLWAALLMIGLAGCGRKSTTTATTAPVILPPATQSFYVTNNESSTITA